MKLFRVGQLGRTLLIAGGVSVLTSGVTFAVVRNQTTLAESRISSATASLKIRSTNRSWSDSAPGFRIKNMIPGEGDTEHIYFKNDGRVGLKLSVHMPRKPHRPHGGFGFRGWENVTVDVTGDNCDATVHTTMAELLGRRPVQLPCGPLAPRAVGDPRLAGHVGNYSIHFDIKQDAITGSHAGVGKFDLQFTGVQR